MVTYATGLHFVLLWRWGEVSLAMMRRLTLDEETYNLVSTILKRTTGVQHLEPKTNLIESAYLDSLSMVNLVVQLQSALGIVIHDDDITEDSFQTPENVAALCIRLKSGDPNT